MKITTLLWRTCLLLFMLVIHTNLINAQLTAVSSSGLPNIGRGEAKFADFDNDGKLDLLVVGQTGAYATASDTFVLYKGVGDGTFTDITSSWFTTTPDAVSCGMVSIADYDKDGYLDFCYGGYISSSSLVFKLYRNTGTGFTDVTSTAFTTAPPGGYFGNILWGDIDSDGDPDLVINYRTGNTLNYPSTSGTPRASICQVYKNNGNGTFTQVSLGTTGFGINYGTCLLADFDLDGDLDMVGQGAYGANAVIAVNDGTGTFAYTNWYNGTNPRAGISYWRGTHSVIGDFNNDGKLDILEAYINNSNAPVLALLTNANAGGTPISAYTAWSAFTSTTPATAYGTNQGQAPTSNMAIVSAIDYNNDGYLDFTQQGLASATTPTTTLYTGAGTTTFTDASLTLTGLHYGNAVWADVNNDGKMDLFNYGYTDAAATTPQTIVYLNGVSTANTAPQAPSLISAVPSGTMVALSWDMPTNADDHTPNAALTYNLRVGTTAGGYDIIYPMANTATGVRKIAAPGALPRDTFTLKNLTPGTYYWSVQAIDANYMGGAWATEGSFTIAEITNMPTVQATMSATPATSIGQTQFTLNWTNGDGYKAVVFMKAGNNASDVATPVNDIYYNANAAFGSGDQIGITGWYCVYNNAVTPLGSSSTLITGLTGNSSYQVMVISYNSKTDKTIINYLTTTSINNPIVISTPDYTVPVTVISLLTVTTNTSGVSVGITPSQSGGTAPYPNVSYPCVVFMKQGTDATEDVSLVANTTYADSTAFGLGAQIGTSGWYCVLYGSTAYNNSSTFKPFSTFTNLLPNTSYQVRACTFDGTPGLEKYSATAGVVFVTPNELINPPAKQDSAITVADITSSTATISWTKGDGAQRVIFITSGTTDAPVLKDSTTYPVDTLVGEWKCIYTGAGNLFSFTGATPNTTYKVVIYGFNGSTKIERYLKTTATDNPKSFTTLAASLSAPVATAASGISTAGFTANWETVTGATGYYLEVATDNAFTSMVTGFNPKDAANVLTYAVTGLTQNTTYYYRIRAYDTNGSSDNSNVITVTTALAAPAAPVASDATSIIKTGFSANWNAVTGATIYYLDVATDNSFASFVTGFENKDVSNVTTFSVTGLSTATTYYYRVRANNAGGTSASSNTITVLTLGTSIANFEKESLKVAVGNGIIGITSDVIIKSIRIMTIGGSLVGDKTINATSANIGAGNLSSGVYILLVETQNGVFAEKLSIIK